MMSILWSVNFVKKIITVDFTCFNESNNQKRIFRSEIARRTFSLFISVATLLGSLQIFYCLWLVFVDDGLHLYPKPVVERVEGGPMSGPWQFRWAADCSLGMFIR